MQQQQNPISVAFLNAGCSETDALHAFDAHKLDDMFRVNVFGVANWLHFLLPEMIAQRSGVIVGTSSLASVRGLPESAIYSASKAAMSVLFESLRLEAKGYGIQMTTVEPGFVATPMTDHNKYPMPFKVAAAPAARHICTSVARGRTLVRFPWPMTLATRVLGLLPSFLVQLRCD